MYRDDEGRLLRVFSKGRSLETVSREAKFNEYARLAGLPAARLVAGPLQLDDGRYALAYAACDGTPATLVARERPLLAYRRIAEVQFHIHGFDALVQAPLLRRKLSERILSASTLSLRQRQEALLLLEGLPQGGSVCHGNFNLGDVLLGDDGDLVSGWRNVAIGNRWSDVARTVLMLRHAESTGPAQVRWMDGIRRRWRTNTYLKAYLGKCDERTKREGLAQMPGWLRINAAARLAENLGPVQGSALLRVVGA